MSNTTQRTLAERLDGKATFTRGPYKTAHVAHSFASQARRRIADNDLPWEVTVNAEERTVRFKRVK